MALHQFTLISGSYLTDYTLLDQVDDYVTDTLGWAKQGIVFDTGAEKEIVYTASGTGVYDEAVFIITASGDRVSFSTAAAYNTTTEVFSNRVTASGILVWPGGTFWCVGDTSTVHLSVKTSRNEVYHAGCGFWDTYYNSTYDPKPFYVLEQGASSQTFAQARCYSYGPRSWGPTSSGIDGEYLAGDYQPYLAAHNTDLNFAATQTRTGQPYLFDPVFYSLSNFESAEVRGEVPGLYMVGGSSKTHGDIITVSGTLSISGTLNSDFLIHKYDNNTCWALGDIVSHTSTTSPSYSYIVLPLTYDENDVNNVMTWVRQGSGPHVTVSGFEGDGYQSRLRSTTIPTWMDGSSDTTAIQATVQIYPEHPRASTTGNTVLHLGANTAGVAPNPKLALRTLTEPQYDQKTYLGLQGFTSSLQTLPLWRPEWKFRYRFPVLTKNGQQVRPQAILFLDADTMVITGHYNNTESVAYKVHVDTGEVISSFSFGGTYTHVASLAIDQSGAVWAADFATSRMIKIDLTASFNTGTVVILSTWILTNLIGGFAIDFITISGTNYVLVAEYDTSGTPYLYVIATSQMTDGSTFNIANRYKRFQIGLRVQGIVVKNDRLYVCRNRNYLDATTTNLYGSMEQYDNISSRISSSADGANFIFTFNRKNSTPSFAIQDVKFHPTTGEIWTQTEGWDAVGDFEGWLSAWSSTLTDLPTENTVNIYYNGSGNVTVRLNNKLFQTLGWNLTTAVSVATIGGPPNQAAGLRNGYFSGYIKNVRFQSTDISDTDYTYTVNGAYEPYTLEEYRLTMTNPGAESGTTGWTNETGSIGTRSNNPVPLLGTAYFFGGANAQTISRQRLDLVAAGIAGSTIDAGNIWAKVRWVQSGFNGQPNTVDDSGSMGIRTLNASQTTITTDYSGVESAPYCLSSASEWFWYSRAHALTVVSGIRYTDALYRADRTTGTNNDAYIDGITMTIYRRPY